VSSSPKQARSRLVHAVQRLVLNAHRTPLRRLPVFAYRAIARATGAYLTRGERDAAVYVRGGVGAGDFLPGLSDLDLAILLPDCPTAPGRAAERVKRRWERLSRALPVLGRLVDLPRVHEDAELEQLVKSSALTYGLSEDGSGEPRAGYFGPQSNLDLLRTLERPGLYSATDDWSLLAGRGRLPREPRRDPQARRIAAWLELVWTWRAASPFVVDPTLTGTASAAVKLVAEPARIWLWLADGERYSGRAGALRTALRRMPEEEPALRRALELQGALSRLPAPALDELLPAALRLSARVAALIADQVADAGTTEVRLTGEPADLVIAGQGQRALALADWRAVVAPELPDESFALRPGDPGDPTVLAGAADRHSGPYPALRAGELMVLPAVPLRRTRLRALKSPVTDPVVFAVAAGHGVAALPDVAGWSARDMARRAIAEHRAWLTHGTGPNEGQVPQGGGHDLGRLLTAARAALFHESLQEGAPELRLTVSATARGLAERSAIADDALGAYRSFARKDTEPPAAVVAAMRELVLELPAYGSQARARPRTRSSTESRSASI
jgi:predicted nucleotidyltransferase